MKIKITTEREGKRFECCMDRELTSLTKSKCNEDWMMDDGYENFWVLSKNIMDGNIQNIDFNFKVVDGRRTLEPIDVLFWDYNDLIDDSDYFSIEIK